jgi:hypothetical protein
MEENMRLRRENAEIEAALQNACADVAAFERRMDAAHAAISTSNWSMPTAAGRYPMTSPPMTYVYQSAYPSMVPQRPSYGAGAHPLYEYATAAQLARSPVRRLSDSATAAAAAAAAPTSTLLPHLGGIDPLLLLRHFQGQLVIPRLEERLANVQDSELQELLNHWNRFAPDAANVLDDYLRRRQHRWK